MPLEERESAFMILGAGLTAEPLPGLRYIVHNAWKTYGSVAHDCSG